MVDSILLGHITRAFGIEGGVFVRLLNDSSHALEVGKKVLLKSRLGDDRLLTISAILGGRRIFFEEITDRDSAEALKGSELWMNRADLPALADDEFYLSDLMNARVFDPQGDLLGEIVGFTSNGPQILFEVKTLSGHLALVPGVKPIVQRIDFINKVVVIDPPVGLLDPMD
jgi:16S rRNA processing protein RimM